MDVADWLSGNVSTGLYIIALVGAIMLAVLYYRKRAIRSQRAGILPRPLEQRIEEAALAPVRADRQAGNEQPRTGADGSDAASDGRRETSASAHSVGEPLPAPPKTILISDNDPMMAFALKQRLQRLGYAVLRSPDSAHAILGALTTKPDLVVLDVNMADGHGLAVCEMLTTAPEYAAIPLIVHTACNDEEIKTRCRELGARYVEKSPKSWEAIQSLVVELLGGRAMENSLPPSLLPALDRRLTVPDCKRPRVICINGERRPVEPIEQRLAALGIEVLETHDVDEGFWTCFAEKPQVVLIHTDLPLPEIQAALYRFTHHPATQDLPILLLKGRGIESAELTWGLTCTKNIRFVEAALGWEGVRQELTKIIPLGDSEPDAALPDHSLPAETFDRRSDNRQRGERGQSAARAFSSRPLKLLCIDSDPVTAKSIALRVRPYGIELKESPNYAEGFYLGLRERPHLILLDPQIPEGDGQFALGKFRNHPLTKDIPILCLTGKSNGDARRNLISLEADGHLSKPLRWKEFFEMLGQFVALPEKLAADYQLAESEEELFAAASSG